MVKGCGLTKFISLRKLFIVRLVNVITLLISIAILLIVFGVISNPLIRNSQKSNLAHDLMSNEVIPVPPGNMSSPILGDASGMFESSLIKKKVLEFYTNWFKERNWQQDKDQEKARSKQGSMTFLVFSNGEMLGVVGVESLKSTKGCAVVVISTKQNLVR